MKTYRVETTVVSFVVATDHEDAKKEVESQLLNDCACTSRVFHKNCSTTD